MKGKKAKPGQKNVEGKEVKLRNRDKKNVVVDETGVEKKFGYAMTFTFCKLKLSEKQKQDVIDIGFGGLLEMDIKRLPGNFCPFCCCFKLIYGCFNGLCLCFTCFI